MAEFGVAAEPWLVAHGPRRASLTALDGLWADGRVWCEAFDDLHARCGDPAGVRSREKWPLVDAHQGDRVAICAGPAGAADAVHVVGRHHGQLVVDDVRQGIDVEPARGDFRRDEDRHLAVLEVVERADALRLALVAVDRGGGDAVALELLGEAVGAVLGAGEDERLVDAADLDELAEQLALAVACRPE